MVWEISSKKSLQQIENHNANVGNKWRRNGIMQRILERKIEAEKERHDKAIAELKNKLYYKKEDSEKIDREIPISSKYPAAQKIYDKVEGYAILMQDEPFGIKSVYQINGKWYNIRIGFGPKKGQDDKNNIDWDNPNVNLEEVEVKKK